MFEKAHHAIRDALTEAGEPLPVSEATAAVDGGDIVAESAVNRFCTVEEIDGRQMVVTVDGGPDFTLDAAESDGTDPEPREIREDTDPLSDDGAAENGATSHSWTSDDDRQVYEVNGIRITLDPTRELVGEPTGDDWYGLSILTNGHGGIPNEITPYFPVEIEPGSRDSEEWMGKVLGEMNRPLLFEGEAGTGKNRAISRALSATNRPSVRTNFGSDVSVFDFVGEKEILDGETVYVLGDAAKAAMFGHTAIWDEVNMATGDVTSFLHAIAETPGNRSLELRGTDVTLTDIPVTQDEIDRYGSWYKAARQKWDSDEHLGQYIHPEFRITATCNPLHYADTNPMNDAFRDRFVVLRHGYLSPDMEARLLSVETGADQSEVRRLCELAELLRQAREEANAISCPITHRALLKTVEVAGPNEQFMSFREAALTVMVDFAAEQADKDYIRDAIRDEL